MEDENNEAKKVIIVVLDASRLDVECPGLIVVLHHIGTFVNVTA